MNPTMAVHSRDQERKRGLEVWLCIVVCLGWVLFALTFFGLASATSDALFAMLCLWTAMAGYGLVVVGLLVAVWNLPWPEWLFPIRGRWLRHFLSALIVFGMPAGLLWLLFWTGHG